MGASTGMRGHAKTYWMTDAGGVYPRWRRRGMRFVMNLAAVRWVGVVAVGIVTGVMLSRLYSWPVVLDNCVLNPTTGHWECCQAVEHKSTGTRCATGVYVRVLENSISDL